MNQVGHAVRIGVPSSAGTHSHMLNLSTSSPVWPPEEPRDPVLPLRQRMTARRRARIATGKVAFWREMQAREPGRVDADLGREADDAPRPGGRPRTP